MNFKQNKHVQFQRYKRHKKCNLQFNLIESNLIPFQCIKYQGVVEIVAYKSADSAGKYKMSRDMRFPTMWYARPAKAQISLRIRASFLHEICLIDRYVNSFQWMEGVHI